MSPARLEVGAPVERELKGGETHNYSFSMEPGQFAALVVDQRGVDVVVRLKAPDGTKISEIDSPNGVKGPEAISLIAKSSGVYVIDVAFLEANGPAGRYEVKLEAIRMATVQDKIADLAAFLVDTKSEADRATRLSREKDLVTAQLADELIRIGAASLRGNDTERAMIAFTHARTIAESDGKIVAAGHTAATNAGG